jgi:hypothetical protein
MKYEFRHVSIHPRQSWCTHTTYAETPAHTGAHARTPHSCARVHTTHARAWEHTHLHMHAHTQTHEHTCRHMCHMHAHTQSTYSYIIERRPSYSFLQTVKTKDVHQEQSNKAAVMNMCQHQAKSCQVPALPCTGLAQHSMGLVLLVPSSHRRRRAVQLYRQPLTRRIVAFTTFHHKDSARSTWRLSTTSVACSRAQRSCCRHARAASSRASRFAYCSRARSSSRRACMSRHP